MELHVHVGHKNHKCWFSDNLPHYTTQKTQHYIYNLHQQDNLLESTCCPTTDLTDPRPQEITKRCLLSEEIVLYQFLLAHLDLLGKPEEKEKTIQKVEKKTIALIYRSKTGDLLKRHKKLLYFCHLGIFSPPKFRCVDEARPSLSRGKSVGKSGVHPC